MQLRENKKEKGKIKTEKGKIKIRKKRKKQKLGGNKKIKKKKNQAVPFIAVGGTKSPLLVFV